MIVHMHMVTTNAVGCELIDYNDDVCGPRNPWTSPMCDVCRAPLMMIDYRCIGIPLVGCACRSVSQAVS
jgi:hypothetical protein